MLIIFYIVCPVFRIGYLIFKRDLHKMLYMWHWTMLHAALHLMFYRLLEKVLFYFTSSPF